MMKAHVHQGRLHVAYVIIAEFPAEPDKIKAFAGLSTFCLTDTFMAPIPPAGQKESCRLTALSTGGFCALRVL
jgi:hypothetical protein